MLSSNERKETERKEEKKRRQRQKKRDDKKKRKAHRIRRAVEAEKRARRDDAFEKHAQHLVFVRLLFWMIL